jgi:hypothetical protein
VHRRWSTQAVDTSTAATCQEYLPHAADKRW